MFFRPSADDARLIVHHVGQVLVGLGALHVLPLSLAIGNGEWNAATALALGAGATLIAAQVAVRQRPEEARLEWAHGLVIVAVAWLVGALFAAIPLYLSGHLGTILDALFESMSGLTTSGLSLTQDLDHLPLSINLWRHLLHFMGGQGIVVVVISVLAVAGTQVGILYVGEGRDERIAPNVVRTARFIYQVAGIYLAFGTVAISLAVVLAGIEPGRALFHGMTLFMAAFDTGGFAPQSTSIAYYHSAVLEHVLMIFMVAGTLSFGLHYQLWRRRPGELLRHTETHVLAASTTVITTVALVGLASSGALDTVSGLFRKGVFTVVSAHTGTGFAVTHPRLFVTDWGALAPAAVVAAMALGGMASSTAGGIKAIRVGIAAVGLRRDITRVVAPPNALTVATYHTGQRRILRDEQIRNASMVLLLYVVSYLIGGLVGLFYGHDFTSAFFESTSAAANVGLSVGITAPGMPAPLEVLYLLQMWLGRLEFLTAFAFVAFVASIVRGRV